LSPVIFDDELNRSANHATHLFYLLDSKLGTLNLTKTGFGWDPVTGVPR
jgi:hypothetical protein